MHSLEVHDEQRTGLLSDLSGATSWRAKAILDRLTNHAERLMSASRAPLKWRSLRGLAVAASLAIGILLLGGVSSSYILGSRQSTAVDFIQPGPSVAMREFWHSLAHSLAAAKPNASEIPSPGPMLRDHFDPHGEAPWSHADVLEVTEDTVDSLRLSHTGFVRDIPSLVRSMPFNAGSQGIVTTSSGDQLGIAYTSIRMLRRTGSALPVQLFLSAVDERDVRRCEKTLASLNTRCLNMDDYLNLPNSTDAPDLQHFQFKVFALIFSSFQQVLFLDSDAFPIRKPDTILSSQPFTSYGLVTWPDLWLSTISPVFYNVASVEPTDRPETALDLRASESGVLLVDKLTHGDSLLLAAYYNTYGPAWYYRLHSQGAWGSGDKETFLQAAVVLRKSYWRIRTYARRITREGLNVGSGMWQADPSEDWAKRPQKSRRRSPDQDQDTPAEPQAPSTAASALFAHLNRIKIDARTLTAHLGSETKKLYDWETDGTPTRFLGTRDDWDWADDATIGLPPGFDLELALRHEIEAATCDDSILAECEKLREANAQIASAKPSSIADAPP